MVGSQTDQPQIELHSVRKASAGKLSHSLVWRLSIGPKKMWQLLGESYQICLIGRGVCRMATRDPPWFRKNTLYSSWKTCRRDEPKKNSSLRWQHKERAYLTPTSQTNRKPQRESQPQRALHTLLISAVLSRGQKSLGLFILQITDTRVAHKAECQNDNSLLLLWEKVKDGIGSWITFLVLLTCFSFW